MRIGTRFNKGMKPNCVLCGKMIMSAKKSNRMFCDVCREKMKINKRCIPNLILSFLLFLFWFWGFQRDAGGICNYWRCEPIYSIGISLLIVILVLYNTLSDIKG